VRSARSMDGYALAAWTSRVIMRAQEDPPPVKYQPKTVNLEFMRNVARLSWWKWVSIGTIFEAIRYSLLSSTTFAAHPSRRCCNHDTT
jgi:hypothetical protein